MEPDRQYIDRLRSSISALGGRGFESGGHEFEHVLKELFPRCQCTRILAASFPAQERAFVRGSVFLVRMFTSLWFFEEKYDEKSVLQEFVQHGFIPIAGFNGGLLGLHSSNGFVELTDSVAVFSEYGDEALNDENIWTLELDIAAVLDHVVQRINAGSPGTIDALLLSINKKY